MTKYVSEKAFNELADKVHSLADKLVYLRDAKKKADNLDEKIAFSREIRAVEKMFNEAMKREETMTPREIFCQHLVKLSGVDYAYADAVSFGSCNTGKETAQDAKRLARFHYQQYFKKERKQ